MPGNKAYTITMIVLTVILLALYALRAVLGRYYRNQLLICVEQCNLELFENIACERMARLLVPPFNIHYMRLNIYLMKEQRSKIDQEFDILLSMKVGKNMKRQVTLKAFYYYVQLKDKARCKQLIESVRSLADEKTVKECDLLYDVYLLRKSNHIDELLDGMEDMTPTQKAINEHLVSLQYENQGKWELAKQHEALSKAYLQESVKRKEE